MGDLVAGLEKALGFLIAALFSVGAYLWKKTDKRIDDVEITKASKTLFESHIVANKRDLEIISMRIDSKADNAEMNRQRDNITELFQQDTELRQEMHKNQITVMNTLTTIATQVAHISGKLDQ